MTKRSVRFFLAGPCTPKGNSKTVMKIGKKMIPVATQKKRSAEALLVLLAKVHRPEGGPLSGQLRLDVCAVVRPPKTRKKKTVTAEERAAMIRGSIRPTSKTHGDRGNLLKMIEDVLEKAGVIEDDAQVVGGPAAKIYGDTEGWIVKARELDDWEAEAESKEWREGIYPQ